MPNIVQGPASTNMSLENRLRHSDKQLQRRYKPMYHEGLNLTPGSKLHNRIVSEVLERARRSERAMKPRFPYWDKVDNTLTAFIELDEAERLVQQKDVRKPVSIVVPESFASLETFLAYMVTIFGDLPIGRITGTGPEDIIGGILLEKVFDVMSQRTRMLLEMMPHWRDGFSYGLGILTAGWDYRMGKRTIAEPIIDTNPYTGDPMIIGFNKTRIDVIQYEGITTGCVDPRRYLPDPDVQVYEPQKGEYVGWLVTQGYMSMLREEATDGSMLINTRYMEGMQGMRSSIYSPSDAWAREALGSYGPEQPEDSGLTQPIDTIMMFIDIIPAEWDMGDSEEPEKWLFGVSADQVVTTAHPMDLDHNLFPVVVCAPDFSGHEFMPTSRMEMLAGYQLVANYLVNTHIIETDKFLKNRFVADPKQVYIQDILKGRDVIRTRPTAWGKGVKDTFEQVQQTDVTRGHMGDLQQILQLSRQHGGSVDALLGVQRQSGERVTKAEFESTLTNAVSRLQRVARIISLQSHLPLFKMHTSHIQQFMSQEVYVSMIGQWEDVLRSEYGAEQDMIRVSPFDINIDYDVIIQDSSLLGGETAGSWIQWLQVMMQSPELTAQTFDLTRIGLHIARLMGNKAPEQFMLNRTPVRTQVVGDQQVLEAEQRGKIVRLGAM